MVVVFKSQDNAILSMSIDKFIKKCYNELMKIMHRYNSKERQHFVFDAKYSLVIRPELLYVGTLKKSPGWLDENHSHNFVEVLFVTEGNGILNIENVSYNIQKGDVIIYNKNALHHEKSSKENPLEFFFLAFDKIQLTNLSVNAILPDGYKPVYSTGNKYDIFHHLFSIIVEEASNKEPFYIEISRYASRELLMHLFRLISEQNSEGLNIKTNLVVDNAVKYIDNHFMSDITLDTVANICFVSKYHLAHLFREIKGCTVKDYITSKRLEEAKYKLVQDHASVSLISEYVGYLDCNYFCRLFKKIEGITPMQYRLLHKEKEEKFTFIK